MAGSCSPSLLLGLLASGALAGCSLESSARDDHASVSLGMTSEEIRSALGEPALIHRDDPAAGETWEYVYAQGNGDALEIFREIVMVLGSLGTLAAAILSGRGTWGTPQPSLTTSSSTARSGWRFSLRFGPDGRVAEISDLR